MQTILGAGGDIGRLLAKELKKYTGEIRLVARRPVQVNGGDQLFPADLRNADEVRSAVEGSEVVYLTAGLPYDVRVWRSDWPVIMQNVIDACLAHHSRLVFFDNVYMYDRSGIPHMTEDTGFNPSSGKGTVRAGLVAMLQAAIRDKGLNALIARSADFYGPGAKNGILNIMVIDNLFKGSRAMWQVDVTKTHSFTFTPDAARATALLGNTEDAYNQTWHLPTSHEKLTGREFIALTARLANHKPAWFTLSPFIMQLGGLFSRQIRELREMAYQYDRDYYFDSRKFEERFHFEATAYEEGIRQVLASLEGKS